MGGALLRFGDRASGGSAPLTLIGKRPEVTRFSGYLWVSPASLDSSPVVSKSARPFCMYCRRYFLICVVMMTSVTSVSRAAPSFGGLDDGTRSASLGGKLIGLPSNFRDCSDPISARQVGSSRIWFLCTERTLSDESRTMSAGRARSWLRPRSRISKDFNSHNCMPCQRMRAQTHEAILTGMGNSLI